MSEYWKSTPKYWCKHCALFVRDTALERSKHEATGKHQGAVKRSLRDIHRNAEQQEREKERAKREIDRLNGVVSRSKTEDAGKKTTYASTSAPQLSEAERQRQLLELAELGVDIPTELRGGVAMAGEWTVTKTRVVEEDGNVEKKEEVGQATAMGVKRDREQTEEEKEQEEAIRGLFTAKRPRWGVGSRQMPVEDDAELDALLSGPLVKTKKEEIKEEVKNGAKEEHEVKKEDGEPTADVEGEETSDSSAPRIKKEPSEDEGGVGVGEISEPAVSEAQPPGENAAPPVVVFKKRKAKAVRQN